MQDSNISVSTAPATAASINAPDITGTPVAGQMATWADANTLQGVKTYAPLDASSGAFASGIRIVTAIPGHSDADGDYSVELFLDRKDTTDFSQSYAAFQFRIASGAVSGTSTKGMALGAGWGTSDIRAAVSGGFVVFWVNATLSTALRARVLVHTQVAPTGAWFTGWTLSDTSIPAGNISIDLHCYIPSSLYLSGNIENVGSITATGAMTAAGYLVNGIQLDGDGIQTYTSDAADTSLCSLCGGGGPTNARGGRVSCYGNEHANTGEVVIEAGNVSGGDVELKTAATSRFNVNYDGTVTVHATTLTSLRDQVIRTGYYAVAWTATPASGYLNADGSAVSRATYAALFAVIGTTFGVGDGSTTFNLPDASGLNTNDIYLHIKT